MSFWQTRKFKELEKKWEKKLAESGFEDAETSIAGERALKQLSDYPLRQDTALTAEAKAAYYQLLVKCVRTRRFDNEIDRLIMTRKAKGCKIVDICRELEANGTKRYRRTVRLIIRKYEDRWGIRKWPKEKLTYHWKPVTAL